MTRDVEELRRLFHEKLEGVNLSSSAQGKFQRSSFTSVLARIVKLDPDDIYVSGTGSRKAYNILNRLSQGKALLRPHRLGVVVLKHPEAVEEAVRYAQRLAGPGQSFGAIAIVAPKEGGEWQVTAVVEEVEDELPMTTALQEVFPDLMQVYPEHGGEPPRVAEVPDVLAAEHRVLRTLETLLEDGFGGVILRGPPGTGKSYYAERLAATLVEADLSRVVAVQFHPSYQYEDFVEGYVPTDEGGFRLSEKHLLRVCGMAAKDSRPHVLLVDEISRADAARVFGEALTYIESTKRGAPFFLASGNEARIPPNVILIGTMNIFDRGVDQLATALSRRLAFIDMPPDVEELEDILSENRVESELKSGIIQFFRRVNNHPNPYCHLGHAYFINVTDLESLDRLWEHQLRFVFEQAFPASQVREGLEEIRRMWDDIQGRAEVDQEPQPPEG